MQEADEEHFQVEEADEEHLQLQVEEADEDSQEDRLQVRQQWVQLQGFQPQGISKSEQRINYLELVLSVCSSKHLKQKSHRSRVKAVWL